MKIPLLIQAGEIIDWQEGAPPQFDGFLLSAPTWYVANEQGLFIFQQVQAGSKWIRYLLLLPNRKISIRHALEANQLLLIANLGADIKAYFKSSGKISVAREQYVIQKSSHANGYTSVLKPFKKYEIVELVFPGSIAEMFATAFKLGPLPLRSKWIMPEEKEMLRELIRNGYSEESRQLYYDIAPSHILFKFINCLTLPMAAGISITETDKAAVRELRRILDTNHRTFPEIDNIAAKIRISPYRLKSAFKAEFGLNVFDYHMHAKMEIAYREVVNTDASIKVIAIDAGFKWPMNFATAFRKKFGEAPETLRKKLRNSHG